MTELPKALQLTEEEKQVKSYAIGTISIDAQGVWHCHYIGHHDVMGKKYFGNGVVSLRNIKQLLNIVGSRLNNKKSTYVKKIEEVENDTPKYDSDGLRNRPDYG